MPIKSKLTMNAIPQVSRQLDRELQIRAGMAADGLREALKAVVASGGVGIQDDTGALGESYYISTGKNSDYDQRLTAAKQAFLSNPSFWKDIIREHLNPNAYTDEHWNDLVLPEELLPSVAPDVAVASVATLLAYATYWEMGHFNAFTQQQEHRPFMEAESLKWALGELAGYFTNLVQ